jgi:hypothetical protein
MGNFKRIGKSTNKAYKSSIYHIQCDEGRRPRKFYQAGLTPGQVVFTGNPNLKDIPQRATFPEIYKRNPQ